MKRLLIFFFSLTLQMMRMELLISFPHSGALAYSHETSTGHINGSTKW